MTEVSDYTSLISGNSWNGMTFKGTPVFISYSFVETSEIPSLDEYQSYENDGYTSFSMEQRVSFRLALAEFEKVSGLRFIEVDNPENAATKIMNTTGSEWGGWASGGWSTESYSISGYLVIDSSGTHEIGGSYAQGSNSFEVLLHEIGHTVGLKHPFEGDPVLVTYLDNDDHTLMSYTGNNRFDFILPHLDVDAVRYLYGLPDGISPNWNYEWSDVTEIFTLVGSDANDTLVALHAKSDVFGLAGDDIIWGREGDDILYGGSGNDVIGGGGGVDILYGEAGNDTLMFVDWGDTYNGGEGVDTISAAYREYGVSIYLEGDAQNYVSVENIIGSSHDDYLLGDDLNNVILGADGADIMRGNGGDDTIDGGGGIDTVDLNGNRSDFSVTIGLGGVITVVDAVVMRDGTDTLKNVEILSFYDTTIDLTKFTVDWKKDTASTELVASTYQFFSGEIPSESGFEYLISSTTNIADLNDPYYAQFNAENRYFNFSNNLASFGTTSDAFDAKYGALSFADAVKSSYSEIVGSGNGDVSFFLNAYDYFSDVANERLVPSGTSFDKAVKIVAIGSVLNETQKIDFGVMAEKVNLFVDDVSTIGTSSLFGHDLLA